MTKNITLAVDERVLAQVRRIAAARDTTVNALVRDYLTRLAEQDDKAQRARETLARLARDSTWHPGEDWQWSREDLYDRSEFHRHQRPGVRRLKQRKRPGKEKGGN